MQANRLKGQTKNIIPVQGPIDVIMEWNSTITMTNELRVVWPS